MFDFEAENLININEREDILEQIGLVLFTKRYKLAQKHLNIFSVQSISMMYSIWEGFIQNSFNMYIQELNSLNIDFQDFSNEIRVFHIDNTFKQFNELPTKEDKRARFYDKLSDFFAIPRHEIYPYINTQSNVSFEILNAILKSFCLETFPEYWQPSTSLIKFNLKNKMNSFLDYRNSVAHGGDISSQENVTQKVYNEHKKMIVDLMYEIHEKMMEGLAKKTYLR